jgi:hypothetical protein
LAEDKIFCFKIRLLFFVLEMILICEPDGVLVFHAGFKSAVLTLKPEVFFVVGNDFGL